MDLDSIWQRWGDEVAEIPLGRVGLATVMQADGVTPVSRPKLDKVLERVRTEGGPNTPPPEGAPNVNVSRRYLRQRKAAAQPPAEIELEPVKIDRSLTEFDREADTYRTFVPQARAWVTTTGDAHRAIVRWYSNWDGDPVSLNGISRRTGLPRAWVIGYLRAHGITHDSAPFSSEEVARRGVDDLAQDALALKFGALATKTEKLSAKETSKAARSWWDFEATTLSRCREWMTERQDYSVPRLRMRRADRPFWLVTSATDFHWGMRSWAMESGSEYNRKEARRRLLQTTEDLASRLPGQPKGITVAVGSDWIHVDGLTSSTTRGTPQHIDGTPLELLITGAELAREHLDILATVAPVHVVLMAGNHDRTSAHALLLYLRAAYEHSDRVTVSADHALRNYQEIGNTLACFTHGDTCKPEKLGAVMSKERREMWGRSRHHVAFGGHLHHQRVREVGGVRHFQLPSLAAPDAWHAGAGYVTSSPGLMGVLIDMEDGPVGTIFAPVRE